MAEVEGNAEIRRFSLNLPLYHVTLRHLATNSGHMKFKGIRISPYPPTKSLRQNRCKQSWLQEGWSSRRWAIESCPSVFDLGLNPQNRSEWVNGLGYAHNYFQQLPGMHFLLYFTKRETQKTSWLSRAGQCNIGLANTPSIHTCWRLVLLYMACITGMYRTTFLTLFWCLLANSLVLLTQFKWQSWGFLYPTKSLKKNSLILKTQQIPNQL